MLYREAYLSYDVWKELRVDFSNKNYVIVTDTRYIPLLVDTTKETVYRTDIVRSSPVDDHTNLTDFEVNILVGVKATGTFTVVDYTALGGATATVAGHALVEGTDWHATTNNNTTAISLAAAINALSEVTAAAPAAAIITVVAATEGVAGNSITLATSDATNLPRSGATLTGGRDASIVIDSVDDAIATEL